MPQSARSALTWLSVPPSRSALLREAESRTADVRLTRWSWAPWAEAMKSSMGVKAVRKIRPQEGALRGAAFNVATSDYFINFIMGVVALNTVMLMSDHWGMEDEWYYEPYELGLLVCNYIYYAEFVLNIVAIGFRQYGADTWHQFEAFLVVATLVDQFGVPMLMSTYPLPPIAVRLVTCLRTFRVIRLLQYAKGLRNLIMSLVLSFPSLVNVTSLLMLVCFIYSVLGVQVGDARRPSPLRAPAVDGVDGVPPGASEGLRLPEGLGAAVTLGVAIRVLDDDRKDGHRARRHPETAPSSPVLATAGMHAGIAVQHGLHSVDRRVAGQVGRFGKPHREVQ